MKLLSKSLILYTLLAFIPLGYAQMPPRAEERLITTQGHGEIRVQPDSLNLSASVETEAPTLNEARARNNEQMQRVIAAIRKLNVPKLTLQTQRLQVYPLHEPKPGNRVPRIIGYRAVNSVLITVINTPVSDLSEYGSKILDAALTAGANNAGGLNFFLTDIAGARTQALQAAVLDAKRNAEAMAQAAGVALTGLYSLEGTPQFGGFARALPMATMKAQMAEADMPATPVEAGESVITSDVSARFKF